MKISPRDNLWLLFRICIPVQKNPCTRKLINNKQIPTEILWQRWKEMARELKSSAVDRPDVGKRCCSLLAFYGSRRSHYKDVPMATNTSSISTVSAYHYTVAKDSLGREDWQVHHIVTHGAEPLGPLYTFFTIKITSGGHLRYSSRSSHKSRLQANLMP